MDQKIPNSFIIELTKIDDGTIEEVVLFVKNSTYGSKRELQIDSANYSKVICYEKGEYLKEKILEIDQEDIYETRVTFFIDKNGFLIVKNDELGINYFNLEEKLEKYRDMERIFI